MIHNKPNRTSYDQEYGNPRFPNNRQSLPDASQSLELENEIEHQEPQNFGLTYTLRHFLAEFFGSFVFIFLVTSSIATHRYKSPDTNYSATDWGFSLVLGLLVSMGSSGGHLNPAITISSAIYKRLEWSKVFGYVTNVLQIGDFKNSTPNGYQTLSSILSANLNSQTYKFPIDTFIIEVALTALFVFCLQAVFDSEMTPAIGFEPFATGFVYFAILKSTSSNSSNYHYGLNPIVDFGPRLINFFVGLASESKTGICTNWSCVSPTLAPIVGAVIGTSMYEYFIIPNKD
ncbi:hypothetical protein BB558_005344 [Smittium angustum]|uniref:Uncharacterized protein n=1 Tax=Smittium angustum TaxID=133377 RepID=A0A2U1J0R7_SMIAN|nr:hypothetical protein BB558_005344 [Smittium angustum]